MKANNDKIATITTIALAGDPKQDYAGFGKFLKTWKGPNGSTISYKVGTTPLLLAWGAFAMLALSTLLWCLCFFFMIRTKKPKNTDATRDMEASEAPTDEYIDDVKAKEAHVVTEVAPNLSFVSRVKSFPMAFVKPKKTPTQYAPIEGVQQQDTSYTSPTYGAPTHGAPPAYEQQSPQTAYEPMRT
jgi:hypothetical protein